MLFIKFHSSNYENIIKSNSFSSEFISTNSLILAIDQTNARTSIIDTNYQVAYFSTSQSTNDPTNLFQIVGISLPCK